MLDPFRRWLRAAAGLALSLAAAAGSAAEPPGDRAYGASLRSFGAVVHSGAYSLRDAPATLRAVGYPHGYPYGRTWTARPWYASPYRYQGYYDRPWYSYNFYYRPRYYGTFAPRAFYGDYGYLLRDPWPYDYSPYGPPCADQAHGSPGGYGGCYYW